MSRDPAANVASMTVGYSDRQLADAAAFYADLLIRRPFGDLFDEQTAPYMVRLLVHMFQAYNDGLLLTKKQAMTLMQAVDSRTSHRYIRVAEEQGFLTVVQASHDQRIDYLCPTERLHAVVKAELSRLATDVRLAAYAIAGPNVYAAQPAIEESDWEGNSLVRNRINRVLDSSAEATEQAAPPTSDRSRARRIARFSETIRLLPNNTPAYIQRARMYQSEREYGKALADLNYAVEKTGGKKEALFERATFFTERDEVALAVADYTSIVELDPTDLMGYFLRGSLYSDDLDNQIAAIEDFTKVVDLPENAEFPTKTRAALARRAQALEKLGRRKQALADYAAALVLDPENSSIKFKIERLSKNR